MSPEQASSSIQLLTGIDNSVRILVTLVIVGVIVVLCRYVYKFFNMFFQ